MSGTTVPTLRSAVSAAADTLAAAGVGTPRVDAELLAAHVAGVDRGRLGWHQPEPAFFDRYRELVAARARRIPLQHLTRTAAFGPLVLGVGPGVFIPRPETESMLDWASGQSMPASPVIVDLCTGTGALALALGNAHPSARVIAVDDAPMALDQARRNANGTSVLVLEADVCGPTLLGELSDLVGTVDLVVANPPYIPDGATLEPEVADHEPAHALFGGPDGMRVIIPIVDLAARLLRGGGRLAIEHDDTTAAQTVAVCTATGVFDEVTARRDLAGRPRFVTATKKGGAGGAKREAERDRPDDETRSGAGSPG